MTINVLSLRDRIFTALSAILGTYTYTNGQTTPALWVEGQNGQSALREKPKVTGLEVVIRPETDMPLTPVLRGGVIDYKTQVVLKQWDITKTTQQAIELLIRALQADLEAIAPRVPRNTDLDSIESCTLTLSNSYAWLLLN